MADLRATITAKINGKKVMIFSKSYCPYCAKAKNALEKYKGKELSPEDYEVWEIENDPRCSEIQSIMKELTGASSVPRVFINGKCIGGGSETEAMDRNGDLKEMLKAA